MNKMSLNKSSVEKLLQENGISKKLYIISTTTKNDICKTLNLEDDDRLQEIINGINVNKRNNGINKGYGIPGGTMECCGYTINIDDILNGLNYELGNDRISHGNLGKIIKDQYEIALNLTGNEKEKGLEKATKNLAGIILLFITELDKQPDDSTEPTTEKSDNNNKLNPDRIYREGDYGKYEEIQEFNFDKLVIRNKVAKQISNLRENEWKSNKLEDIKGKIELRDGIIFDLNDKSFKEILEYYGKQYKDADDKRKMEIDTELAERIILHCGYYIQINDSLNKSDPNYVSSYIHCRDGLKKINLDVKGEHIKHKGEEYLVVKLVNDTPIAPEESSEENETLGEPKIDDIYTDSTKGNEMMKKLIESGALLVDYGDGEGFKKVSDFDPNMPELRKNIIKFKDESGNVYILDIWVDIWDKDTHGKTVRGPSDTEPADYYYYFKKLEENVNPPIIPIGPDDGGEDPKSTKKKYIKPITTIKPGPDDGGDGPDKGGDGPKHTDLPTSFEESVVLSDVSDSYEDMISREVENELNEERHNTARYNLFKRGKLFLMRGKMRKERIKNRKESYQRTPFTNNGLINEEMSKQASRHDLEEILQGNGVTRNAFGEIKRETLISEAEIKAEGRRGKPFKEMCQEYVAGTISKVEFQNRFNALVKKLGAAVNQNFLATNVLEKLDAIKNDNLLLGSITNELTQYLSDHNNSHFDAIRTQIDTDFKKYRRDPRFRKEIMDILGNTAGLTKEQLDKKIEKFMRHQRALAKMSTQNLQIKLDLLTNGKGAYQINNKDRNKNWLFQAGNFLDKMPRWGQALTVAGISASGMLVAGLGGSALAATAIMSGLVGAKNFIKKWTHHTKEQNTYEKNLTRNYEEEIAKMKEWKRIRNEKDSEGKYTHKRFSRYRAKRQLELYGKTTQEHLQNENEGNTKEISAVIYGLLDRYDTLSPEEKNALHCTLLDAKARLETYRAIGHNFLKSKDKNQIERDFYELENALNLSASRILGAGSSLNDISLINAYDASGKAVNYNDLLDLYKKDYNSATKEFKFERAFLATKWGLGTAAFTFGTSAAIQYARGTGMFAKEAVPGTPGTPDSHETLTANGKDYYGLGKYETSDSGIFRAAQDNIAGLESGKDGITYSVKVHLSSGTDGTQLTPGSSLLDPRTYQAELQETINAVKNSCLSNKAEIISHLEDGLPTNGFTNHALYSMRDLNAIEQIATGSGNFNGTMEFIHDVASGVDGHIAHDATSRFTQAAIEITKTVAGQPGTDPVEGGTKWLVFGLPGFSNTFQRKNDGKPKQKPAATVIDKTKDNGIDTRKDNGDDKTKDNGDDNGKDKQNNKGHSSNIIVPPEKSDERDEEEETTDKKNEDSPFEEFNKTKKGKYVQEYLDKSDDFKPKYKIQGPNGNDMYVSKIIKGSSHKYIVGYTKIGDEMELRLFWKSNSGGSWRAGLGEAGNGVISKGQNIPNAAYETTTKIDNSIGEQLDKISEETNSNLNNHPLSSFNHPKEFLSPDFKKEITIKKLFNVPYNSSVDFYQGKQSADVQDAYKNMDLNGLEYENMKAQTDKNYSYEHKYLGKVNVEAYTMDRNGESILVYFSKSEKDNKVWIENVTYPDAKINSFGTYDKQINASPLTAKPIDYKSQAPSDLSSKSYGSDYIDIRDLYQENPIIRKYKELAKIKESE